MSSRIKKKKKKSSLYVLNVYIVNSRGKWLYWKHIYILENDGILLHINHLIYLEIDVYDGWYTCLPISKQVYSLEAIFFIPLISNIDTKRYILKIIAIGAYYRVMRSLNSSNHWTSVELLLSWVYFFYIVKCDSLQAICNTVYISVEPFK